MSTTDAFLHSIEADLADPAPLLIYADWLEERDDLFVQVRTCSTKVWLTGMNGGWPLRTGDAARLTLLVQGIAGRTKVC
jgi:uncharacterized protein (TIGR02996 family)